VMNVANAGGYPVADDVESFARRLFQFADMFRLLMTALPHVRASSGSYYRSEPVYVFRKPQLISRRSAQVG
jgi:hypothetical protein